MTASDWLVAVLNMSLSATWTALLVMLARLLLRRAPKVFSYALWAVVWFRMVCPVSFEGIFSLTPVHTETIPKDIAYTSVPRIQSGIPPLDQAVNQSLPAATPAASANPMQILLEAGAWVWIAGMVLLAAWSFLSYLRFRKKLAAAVWMEGNVFSSDRITTAFVLGFFRPRIYLPLGLAETERQYILCHERVHIRRGDHWIKTAALLAVFVHWFNPVLWLAYRLMCRDMEMSCDEQVINRLGEGIRRNYSNSLLSISMRRSGLASPLAFGENETSGRIKNVLRYKKPAFWVLLALLAAVAVLTVCLAANPKGTIPLSEQEGIPYHDNIWGETVTAVLPGRGNSYLLEDAEDIQALAGQVSSLHVTRQPVSQDQDIRPWDFSLAFQRPLEVSVGNFVLYFTADSVWCSDGFRTSPSYGVEGSEISQLLQSLEGYAARAAQQGGEVLGGYYVGFRQVSAGVEGPLCSGEDSETGRQLASLLLSGTEVPGAVDAVPPVASYLLIQMGEPDAVYYVYQDGETFYMEKAGEYRLQMAQENYERILELYRDFAGQVEENPAQSSYLAFQQLSAGESLRQFSLMDSELAGRTALLLQGDGDAEAQWEMAALEGLDNSLRVTVGEPGNDWYLYQENGTVYAGHPGSHRVALSDDAARQIWDTYLWAAGEGVSQAASRFSSLGNTMEEIARDGILGYYSAFGADDLPQELRLENFQLQQVSPMAGDLDEFAVSIICSYWTPAAQYWLSANGNSQPQADGSWLWFDCYQEFRFRRTGEGEYVIADIGTGGIAQGLAGLEPSAT